MEFSFDSKGIEQGKTIIDTLSFSYNPQGYVNQLFTEALCNPIIDLAQPGDQMVHTSSFCIVSGVLYSVFMVNYEDSAEIPSKLNIRFTIVDLNTKQVLARYPISSVGNVWGDKRIEKIYDSVVYHKDGVIHIIWNAQLEGEGYSLLHISYFIESRSFSSIERCTLKVNGKASQFEQERIAESFSTVGISPVTIVGHLILMPKETYWNNYFYTGLGCAGQFNGIVRTLNFLDWEYVSSPSFTNEALYEPCVYMVDNIAYYYCRQNYNNECGFLTKYNVQNNVWEKPVYVMNAQSRPDFIYNDGHLYLVYAPQDRNHISIVRVEPEIRKSYHIQTADCPDCFYPFCREYEGKLYMLYTCGRKHIYFTSFTIADK